MNGWMKRIILEMNLLVGLDRPCGGFEEVAGGVASPRVDRRAGFWTCTIHHHTNFNMLYFENGYSVRER